MKISKVINRYLNESSDRLAVFITKNKEPWDAFGYKQDERPACALCKFFSHPRDGFGECYNSDNAKKFLDAADRGSAARLAFSRDNAIPVEMLASCPNFKKA